MRMIDGRRFLVVYSGVLTFCVVGAVLTGFTDSQAKNARFDTLTVQRINVVEPDGTLRMVLTNNKRIPGIIMSGHEYPDFTNRKTGTDAGILFYDAHGSESGGLTFGGRRDQNGTIPRFCHLSFDRHNQDQMFSIDAVDRGTSYSTEIRMIDQPTWSIVELLDLLVKIQNLPREQQEAEIARFFATHPQGAGTRVLLSSEQEADQTRNALRFIDTARQDRLRLGIDANSVGALEFLDQQGTIIHKEPPQ